MRKARVLSGILNVLPKRLGDYICNKLLYGYINKYAKVEVINKDNLSSVKSPCIFLCNHLSNADGMILNDLLKDYDPSFVAGVKLSNDPVTNIGIRIVKTIPINPGSADKEALTRVIKTLKDGENIMIFPEGTRSREGSMIEAKKGILLIARLSKAQIVPLGMWGTEKLLPINKSGDMSHENFNHAEVKVNIGKPIELPKKGKDEDRHEYDDRALKFIMGNIAKLIPEEYRGVYK
ncbi:lysophospholipid acyltransferase family protein [Clostridium hydrogeniformans]|uniref:lysophospholipid acyltransferase family protein n=1 Tax=Clostridium hydrogeniformans TaxID=349933 RepID=UPI00054FCAF0|nr:lysophospholipid acyltransferase family protein [Clostridium hydrogeniformans]